MYCASLGLFFAVDAGNRSASESLKAGIQAGKLPNQAAVFIVAAASNALAALTFIFLCRKAGAAPRLAMIGLPLLLLLEQHARTARRDRGSRRLEALLAAGMALGIIGAVAALIPGAPFS